MKEIKAETTEYVIPDEFLPLVEAAQTALQPICPSCQDAQAIVIRTKDGKMHSSAVADWFGSPKGKDEAGLCPEEQALLEELRASGSVAELLLCMWKSSDPGTFPVSVPSAAFRVALCTLHRENKNARILLVGGKNYLTQTVFEGLPPMEMERFAEEE